MTPTAPVSRARQLLLLAVLPVALLVAACGPPSNVPDSYDEPIVSTTLEQSDTTVSTEVSLTAANFLQGCLDNGAPLPECQCIYDWFVANLTIDEFNELDSQLDSDPNALPDNVKTAIDGCRGGSAPTTAPSGTASTTPEGTAGTTVPTSTPQ